MGVLNTTPDSFFKDSRRRRSGDAASRGLELEEQGADILDIGGESTRPPFRNVLPVAEEIRRVVPVIEALRKRLKIPISIDTFKAEVARAAISAGAEIVNDIGALRLDRELPKVVASERVAVVLMHSRGKPEQMHHLPRVRNILRTVVESLECSVRRAVLAGISKRQIIVDPGIGFSKTPEDNLAAAQTTGHPEPPWASNLGWSVPEILPRQSPGCSGGAAIDGQLGVLCHGYYGGGSYCQSPRCQRNSPSGYTL